MTDDTAPPLLLDAAVRQAVEALGDLDPPARLLSDGLSAIRRAVALASPRPAGAVGPPRWGRLPARLAAAAAAAGDGVDRVELDDDAGAYRTRWERSPTGALSVTVTARDPGADTLLQLSWRAEPGATQTLITPLAPAADGAFVRYEVEDVDRRRRTLDIEVSAAAEVAPDEVDLDAVRQAFARRPRGVVIRAWRTFLDRSTAPGPLDAVVRGLLADYET